MDKTTAAMAAMQAIADQIIDNLAEVAD